MNQNFFDDDYDDRASTNFTRTVPKDDLEHFEQEFQSLFLKSSGRSNSLTLTQKVYQIMESYEETTGTKLEGRVAGTRPIPEMEIRVSVIMPRTAIQS